jgi:hypothetical protein
MSIKSRLHLFRPDAWIVACTIVAVLAGIVLFRAWEWDVTAYHLPFSARQLNITRYRNISALINERYQGFPVLWRYALAPGLILDNPRLLIVPNLIAACTVGYTVRRLLNVGFFLGVAATLCFPISYLGFASAYPDYFTNCFAFAGALFLSHWMFALIRRTEQAEGSDLIAGLALLAIAANTKTQGFLMSVIILASTIIYGWVMGRYDSPSHTDTAPSHALHATSPHRGKRWGSGRSQLAIAAILAALIFFQPVINLTRFQNPFYPVGTLGLQGPQAEYSTPVEYLPRIPLATNALSHYLSASEIDPYLLPGGANVPPPTRSLGMFSQTREARTGGTIGLIYLGLLVLFLLNTWRILRSGVVANHVQSLSIFLPLLSLAISTLPQSLELRYYLVSLYVVSLGALVNPINSTLQRTAKIIIIAGLIASTYHLGLYGRDLLKPEKHFNLKSELPSVEQCMEKGKLITASKGRSVLILDPHLVPNNLPFQCRLVLPESIFIDYTIKSPPGSVPSGVAP